MRIFLCVTLVFMVLVYGLHCIDNPRPSHPTSITRTVKPTDEIIISKRTNPDGTVTFRIRVVEGE